MLSESTARLVENSADLGETEMVRIKGGAEPVKATLLLGVTEHRPRQRSEPSFVGRTWELNTITGILGEAVNGAGCVVGVMGPPGIGKSRLVREAAAVAAGRGVEVIATHCDSHAADIPFYAVSRLLRAAMHIDDLDAETARARVRDGFVEADPEDLLLLDDLLGIRDFAMALPDIASDARRRRLTALINSASLARSEPALYVIEDAHWIDEASESLLADFLAVIPQVPSLTLITYRPEYRGSARSDRRGANALFASAHRCARFSAHRRTAGPGFIGYSACRKDRRESCRQPILRRGDRARPRGTRCAAGPTRCIPTAGVTSPTSRCPRPASNHRRAHRPAGATS